ncbi:hypothetical protein [Rhizobium sp. NFACC06-2]|uniref:hypothetical protein n=1 Tax=Rhizobium sp. NFACC06-2 TaxID=1566264 RepID=UPI00122CDD83|nr:hypothetical protein [Rhizobium sp. NFACC06-2]
MSLPSIADDDQIAEIQLPGLDHFVIIRKPYQGLLVPSLAESELIRSRPRNEDTSDLLQTISEDPAAAAILAYKKSSMVLSPPRDKQTPGVMHSHGHTSPAFLMRFKKDIEF